MANSHQNLKFPCGVIMKLTYLMHYTKLNVCVCACVYESAIEIQTIGPISMKFGTIEDHDYVMFFVYV